MLLIISSRLLFSFFCFSCQFAYAQLQTKHEICYDIGKIEFNKGNYGKALQAFNQSYQFELANSSNSISPSITYLNVWIANCYYKMGMIDKAIASSPKDYLTPPVDRQRLLTSDSLSLLAINCINSHDFHGAIQYLNRVANIELEVMGNMHPWYANTLALLVACYFNLQKYTEAYDLASSCLDIYSLYSTYKKEYDDLFNFSIQVMDLIPENKISNRLTFYKQIYENSNDKREKFDNAFKCSKYAFKMRDYQTAIEYAYMSIPEQYQITESSDCERLMILVGALISLGKLDEAILESEKILEICQNDSISAYGSILKILGELYYKTSNYKNASSTFLRLYEHNKKFKPYDIEDNIRILNSLVSCFRNNKNYSNALKYSKELITQYKAAPQLVNNFDKIQSLTNTAIVFVETHDVDNVVLVSNLVLNAAERLFDKKSIEYTTSLLYWYGMITLCDDATEKVGIEKVNETLNTILLKFDSVSWKMASDEMKLRLFAGVYLVLHSSSHNSSINNFVDLAELCMKIMPDSESFKVAKGYFNRELADYYRANGNYIKAYTKYKLCLDMNIRGLSESKPIIFGMGASQLEIGKILEASTNFNKVIDDIRDEVVFNFSSLISSERYGYFKSYENIFDDLNYYTFKNEKRNAIAPIGYNAQLLAKGILLNTDIELRKLIMESNDDSIRNLYDDLKCLKKTYNQLLQLKKYDDCDSIKKLTDNLERILVEKSSKYRDFVKSYKTKWQDVQQKIQRDAIAVEFVSYKDIIKQKVYFGAYVLYSEGEPICVPLCSEQELKAKAQHPNLLYSLIWNPILNRNPNIHNVYFSPVGMLNILPLESIKYTELDSNCNFYRLTSTKELIKKECEIGAIGVVVYGGIDYDISLSQKDSLSSIVSDVNTSTIHRGVDNEFFYLLGTKSEAETIVETFDNYSKIVGEVSLFTNEKGTEDSFKNLDGGKKRIIHIATHGFYYPEEELSTDLSFNFIFENNYTDNKFSEEDKALERCGLLFAGANNTHYIDSLSHVIEDGILTALEISTLDLRGLDLVALSACETALGDITGDGVFGLQRGFKKAGAQSILMSLWKVDDEATCLLMTEFYKNWIGEGKTKHDALELAKQAVRSHKEKGWDDPKYWAAFILLDALD